ncbi:MAG: hypothetical protein CMH53_09985 [Myxococcales bacterium]|nr:hypothetical protein [Myxococcales bacterium]
MEKRDKPTQRWEWLLASRLLRGRRSSQLSLISTMSISGIALGVAALIVVLAVNTGFQTAFQERILSTYPHLITMRRGLDMADWREVVERIGRLPWVRQVGPATYDEMMLSSAAGRAGAVVRGVEPSSLASLPAGLISAGQLPQRGDAPTFATAPANRLRVDEATAGTQHLVVMQGPTTQPLLSVSVLRPQVGLAGLLLVDLSACQPSSSAPSGEVRLVSPASDQGQGDVIRRAPRAACRTLRMWETVEGPYRLTSDGLNVELPIQLVHGETTVVILNATDAKTLKPLDPRAPDTVATLALVNLGTRAIELSEPALRVGPGRLSSWVTTEGVLPSIALGVGLAKRLAVKPGAEVRAISSMRDSDGARGSRSAGRFRVKAILSTGFHDHDQRLAMIDFCAAQRFVGRGDVARWVDARIDDPLLARQRIPELRAAVEPRAMADLLEDAKRAREFLERIEREPIAGLDIRAPDTALGTVNNWSAGVRAIRQARSTGDSLYRFIDWEEMNRNIFDAARLQKVAMSLFPFIIVLVAALNVIGTQAVVVHERSRDISILRAMGATGRSVGAVFLTQGLAVGLWGTLIGLFLGGLFAGALAWIGFPLDPHVYLIDRLPVQLSPATFLVSGGASVFLTLFAAWFSARRAALRPPVEGLRRLD